MKTIFILLIIYQIKHFLCDYPLQTAWMLNKFKSGWDWVLPLLAHSLVHAVFTYTIALAFRPELALSLAIFDLLIHFTMDRIKASPDMLGKYKMLSANEYIEIATSPCYSVGKEALRSNRIYWISLGLDQLVHHLTHYVIIYRIIVGG